MDEVRLPDLQVIRRFSIAVRAERAPVEEVVEALQADLEAILGSKAPAPRAPAASARKPAAGKAAAKKPAAKKPAAKKTGAKRTTRKTTRAR